MTPFCTDTDLLHWEPNLLKDAAFASQTLISGTATLDGATLTIASGSLTDAHVEAGQAVVLGGAVAGCFPIVAVTSATTMTLSVLYAGMLPDEAGDTPVPSPLTGGSVSGLTFVVRTFWPQRRTISELLIQAAGADVRRDFATGGTPPAIVNPSSLRRACTLGTLQMIYSALAAASATPAELKIRADLYERMYRRALRSAKVDLDLDGDGRADCRRELNVLALTRR
jgi:hypothetical protein